MCTVISAAMRSVLLLSTVLLSSPVWAFPDRPVDLVVPWGAGGGADKAARILSPELEKVLKVAVPVTNTPGAAGNTGLGRLNSNTADGYTFAAMTGVTFATFVDVSPYKITDFDWLVRTQETPSMLFVAKDSRFKTFADVEAFAKQNPGKLKVATDGLGAPGDLSLRYLASKGIKMVNVPFDKPAERYTAPLGGHVDLLYEEPGDVREFLVSGRIRPILTFSTKRFPDYKDVPTSYELGFNVALSNWRGFVMKKGSPPEALEKLSNAIRQAMKSAHWKAFCEREWSCDDEELAGEKFQNWAADQLKQLRSFSKNN